MAELYEQTHICVYFTFAFYHPGSPADCRPLCTFQNLICINSGQNSEIITEVYLLRINICLFLRDMLLQCKVVVDVAEQLLFSVSWCFIKGQ